MKAYICENHNYWNNLYYERKQIRKLYHEKRNKQMWSREKRLLWHKTKTNEE